MTAESNTINSEMDCSSINMMHFLPTTKWNTLDQLQFSTETKYMEDFIIIFNILGSLDEVFF